MSVGGEEDVRLAENAVLCKGDAKSSLGKGVDETPKGEEIDERAIEKRKEHTGWHLQRHLAQTSGRQGCRGVCLRGPFCEQKKGRGESQRTR